MEIPTISPLLDEPIIELDNEVQTSFKNTENNFYKDDDVPEMSFEESKGSNMVDDGKVSLKEASKTSSKWLSTILFKVIPEYTHIAIKIDEKEIRKKAERPNAPKEYKELLKEIEETNDRNKEALQIDEDFKEMFDDGLRDWFIDKGAEVQLSPLTRVIGSAVLIIIMFGIQVFSIWNSNKRMEKKIQAIDKKLEKEHKKIIQDDDDE